MEGRISPFRRLSGRTKDILALCVSCLVSLVLLEVGLRTFTDFPVTETSNKVPDPILGYHYLTTLADIDDAGFRNPPGHTAEIAAIGDSHTYGVNVTSEQSWPAQLATKIQRNVYTYGVGSFGVFAYYALARRAIEDDAKTVLIGLYPANDFVPIYSNCMMSWENGGFWWTVSNEIGTNKVACRKKKRLVGDGVDLSFRSIVQNSAIYSVLVHVILKSGNTLDEDVGGRQSDKTKDRIEIGKSATLNLRRVERQGNATDPENAEIGIIFENFKGFALDLQHRAMTNCADLGVILLPSKARVMLAWLSGEDGNENLKRFLAAIQREIEFEEKIVEFLTMHGISVESTLPDVLAVFSEAVAQDQAFYPGNDGHPIERGYEAYADAAVRLVQTLSRVRNADADCQPVPPDALEGSS